MSIFSESVQDTADLEKLHQRSFEKNKGVVLFKHSTRCIISKTVLRNLSAEWEVDEQNLPICLLYTSPSPRDLSTSRMPSSA